MLKIGENQSFSLLKDSLIDKWQNRVSGLPVHLSDTDGKDMWGKRGLMCPDTIPGFISFPAAAICCY